ncbi:MAG: SpoIIE family protein phosphatase [Microscillaceae bacterium]|jgi:serine phosphatase RsbU (regulator of sigma subunit)|nr:SpoIIE family protein phosphatase [Microscillaceae bacterium]
MRFCKLISLLLLSLLWTNQGFAQAKPIIELSPQRTIYEIGKFIYFYEDKTNQLTFTEISKPDFNPKFSISPKEALNFGVSASTIWIKFTLKNQEPAKIKNWLISLDYPLIDYINLYESTASGQWKIHKNGDMLPFAERAVKNRNFTFPITLDHTEPRTYYLQCSTTGSLQINLNISSELRFSEDNTGAEIGYGIFFGVILIMILYNLFIFFSLQDFNYLYYVVAIGMNLMVQVSFSGHGIQYLWGNFPAFANTSVPIFMAATNVTVLWFTVNFLHTRQYAKTLHIVFLVIIGISLINIVLAFFLSNRTTISLAGAFAFLNSVLLLLIGLVCYRNGNRSARFFIIAWALFLIGAFLTSMRNFGLIAPSFLTIHGLKIGAMCEVFLLSLALSDKYNLFRKEKEEAQAESLRIQKEANETLEQKVQERTQQLKVANDEITQQRDNLIELNEEIQQQKEEILAQRNNLEVTYADLEWKNKQIVSSITYAKRIQDAMLPSIDRITTELPESFVMFRPRDIVSGDFYYFEVEKDKIIIAAIDCTGHGVPGAFMSMMSNEILGRIINEKHITSPDLILAEMHLGVKNALKQSETNNRDGMDMAILVIDKAAQTVEYAGAKNSLYYCCGGEIQQINASKQFIGGLQVNTETTFDKHLIPIQSPTTFYIYSDGYQDEFGGPDGKKFMAKNFRKLLHDIHQEPMNTQKEILERTMDDWLGNQFPQIDDILVIGVRL